MDIDSCFEGRSGCAAGAGSVLHASFPAAPEKIAASQKKCPISLQIDCLNFLDHAVSYQVVDLRQQNKCCLGV